MASGCNTARTGKLGKAVHESTLLARITTWSVNESVGETAWGDSDSGNYTNREGARQDCTGTIEGKLDDTSPPYDVFRVGDKPKLVLWENASDYWVFTCCLIQSYTQTVDMDTKEVIGWSANFGADGTYYAPGQSGAPSESLPS